MTTAACVVDLSRAVPRARRPFAFHILPFVAADAVAVYLAAAVTVLARYALGGEFELSFYLRMSGVTALFLVAYAILGLYPNVVLHPVVELQGIFRGTTLTILLLGTMTFFVRDAEAYSRAVLLASWVLIMVAVWFGRVLLREYLSRCEWWGERTVILGAGSAGRTVAEMLRQRPSTGLRVVAVLDDDAAKLDRIRDIAPVAAPLSAAVTLADDFGVRCAIIAMPNVPGRQLAEIVERYGSRFHHVYIIPDLFGISSLGVDARELGGMLGVKVSHRLLHRTPQLCKRIVDIIAACAGAIIRLTSRGPALYGHQRVGARGETFTAWKFRTMINNSEEALRHHLAEHPELGDEWRRDQKLRNDPRITWIGRILRRTSFDELPQLWNVIRGEMSLVGPRPIVENEIERYGPRYSLYRRVRPGLTGLWQVSGRNNLSYAERVHLDEYYVRNWSIWLDLYILSRTIKVVVTGEGAY
jgi:Undecaprenyl-phosphate galactose phosphotransferase WbaP